MSAFDDLVWARKKLSIGYTISGRNGQSFYEALGVVRPKPILR